ncbi:Ig-like domain-containing protein [Rheinheimera sp. WS51]|uniref:Ig-like domain-containing protein n=1 Tax=Rheinheimera sp. WS51 TaxID=3425886 RepID=UPI003D8B592A
MRFTALVFLILFSLPATALEIIAEIPSPFEEQIAFNLTPNSFVLKTRAESGEVEVWRINPDTNFPESWLQFNEVKPDSSTKPIYFTALGQDFWVAGINTNGTENIETIDIAHYQANGNVSYISVVAPTDLGYILSDAAKWHYINELDLLVGRLIKGGGDNDVLLLCQQAKQLRAENCRYKPIEKGELTIANRHIIIKNNSTMRLYSLTQAYELHTEFYTDTRFSEMSYWPGSDRVQFKTSGIDNGVSYEQFWQLSLADNGLPKELEQRSSQASFNNAGCLFYVINKALCISLNNMTFLSHQPEQDISVKFEYQGSVANGPTGELMAVAGGNRIVTATRFSLTVLELPLPEHKVLLLPEEIALFSNDEFTLNKADFFSDINVDNISLRVSWQSEHSSVSNNILIPISSTVFKVDTEKKIARFNPRGSLLIDVIDGMWNAYYKVLLSITNINAAPIATSRVIHTETLEIDQSYQLELSDIFTDPDLDILVYISNDLPDIFALIDGVIVVTPKQAESFSFTVTATDPAGLSAQATIMGKFSAPNNPKSNPKSDAGTLSVYGLLILLCFVRLRMRKN